MRRPQNARARLDAIAHNQHRARLTDDLEEALQRPDRPEDEAEFQRVLKELDE